jgi:hypothetical protein
MPAVSPVLALSILHQSSSYLPVIYLPLSFPVSATSDAVSEERGALRDRLQRQAALRDLVVLISASLCLWFHYTSWRSWTFVIKMYHRLIFSLNMAVACTNPHDQPRLVS